MARELLELMLCSPRLGAASGPARVSSLWLWAGLAARHCQGSLGTDMALLSPPEPPVWGSSLTAEEELAGGAPALGVPSLQRRGAAQSQHSSPCPLPHTHTLGSGSSALGAGPVPAAQDLGLPSLPSILHCFTLSCSALPSLAQSVPVSFCMSWAV